MRSYTLFDEKNVATDWVSEKLAEGNCSASFGSMGKYWAFYSDGRLWEATLFENSRHELRLVNRDCRMKCDIVCMMDRLQRLSDSLDELRLEVGWDGKYTLVILDYESCEVRILQVDNDEIKRKWNDDVSEYVTGDHDKGGLGYGRDQVECLYSCEVRMRADFITNYG